MKKTIIIIILTALFSSELFSANYGGNYGAGIENEGHTEYFATGKIYAKNPVSAIYSNPAGITECEKILASVTTAKLFTEIDGIKQSGLDFLMPVSKYNFGLSYSILSVDDIREANNSGLTGYTFDSKMETIRISAAKKITENLSVGIQPKFFKHKIKSYTNSTFSLNAGVLYVYKFMTFANSIENLFSTKDSFIREKEKLPLNFESGITFDLLDFITAGFVLNYEEKKDLDFRIGLKAQLFKYLAVNAGYVNETKQPSAGFTLDIKNIGVYYGLTKHKDLDLTHKISIDYIF
ncbi:MAG TPA: type IX secretion system membrane protein PorP/SprF [bacterium]|nr:type IX secretion system membrane protein PorP/SprF [bacterium]HPN30815.1 type IX secretion system membrane protein PorP/SprF [bacterium]